MFSRSLMVLTVALSVISCTTDYSEIPSPDFITTIYADTPRTSFDDTDGSVSWLAGDKLALLYCQDDNIISRHNGTATSQTDGMTGEFEAVLNGTPEPPATSICRFYALYPRKSFISAEGNRIHCSMPTVQNASAASYDTDAAVLYGISEAVAGAVPENVSMSFRHIAAYGAIDIIPPASMASSADPVYVTVTAELPLAGGFSFDIDGNGLSAETNIGKSLRINFTGHEPSARFACIPTDLSGTPVTVTFSTSVGICSKTFTPERLKFVAGRTSRFTVNMSECTLGPQIGDVLWSDDFETALPTAATAGKADTVLGEYDPAAEGSSCRLFGNADRSGLVYTGSYAMFTEYTDTSDPRFDGVVFAHKGSSDGFIAIENIPVYSLSAVELVFGTNASSCSITAGYDGVYSSAKLNVAPEGSSMCRTTIDLPAGTKTLSLRISGNSKLMRRFDNFTLLAAE